MSDRAALFHVPAGGPYLLAHSAGCLPRSARGALEEGFLQPWEDEGGDAWGPWLGAVERFRGAVTGLIGADKSEVCPQLNVSAALSRLLTALPREPGRDVLLAHAHSFPSIGFAMTTFDRFGYRLELIPETEDPAAEDTWTARIGPHVAAVVPMLVFSNSSRMSPAAAIAEAARSAGALSVLDICQAVGSTPIDLRTIGVDAAIGSSLKWLCGGPGAGFLWIRGELIADLAPLEVGWFSHANPFEFDIRDFRYAPDALRFWGGTPSVAPYALAAAGIETVAAIGVDAIHAHNRACIAAVAAGCGRPLDMAMRGGTLCLASDRADAMEAALRAVGCRLDRRGDTLRLSFHIWNQIDDGDAIGGAIRPFRFALA